MLRVGLTGGIGAGKSTVAALLAARGAVVIDADRLAREVVEPGTAGLAEVVAAFGPLVLSSDGVLDRAQLGRRVFSDEAARLRLNAILHPRIAALTAERLRVTEPGAVVVHDVPLLVENDLGPNYHLVIVVQADLEERIRRLVAERGMSPTDARARVAAQADDVARRAAADVWLDNSGAPEDLAAPVDQLWTQRLLPYAENLRLGRPAAARATPSDPGDRARVIRRIRRAADGAAVEVLHAPAVVEGDVAPLEVVLRVPDVAAADRLREPLEEAGFLRVAAGPGDDRLHRGADPCLAVAVHVRAAGPASGRDGPSGTGRDGPAGTGDPGPE